MAWAAIPGSGAGPSRTPRRRLWTTLTTAVAVLLLVVLLGPVTGRWRLVPVISGSMTPTYPLGSLVLASPMPASQLEVGDVVLFQAPVPGEPTVMHRIDAIEVGDEGAVYRTKGDANPAVDPWRLALSSEQAWRVRGSVAGVGRLALALQQRAFQAVGLSLAVLLVAAVSLQSIWRRDDAATPPRRP